jgi:flagellar hook-length control protein FliK
MMVFNPIFINPQKFLSPPEVSGVKKNKFTYLFSDIIKNSLGTDKSENLNFMTGVRQSGETNSALKISPIISNTENSISKTEEELVLELTNIISMISNINPNSEARPQIILSETNGKNEIISDAKSISNALNEIIELVNKYGFSVEEGNIKIPTAEAGAAPINDNGKINNSQTVQKILNSITLGKQLTISLHVGESVIDVEVNKLTSSNKLSGLVPEENLKPASELIVTNKPDEKSANQILKDSGISRTAESVKGETNAAPAKDLILTNNPGVKLVNPILKDSDISPAAESVKGETSTAPAKELILTNNPGVKLVNPILKASDISPAAEFVKGETNKPLEDSSIKSELAAFKFAVGIKTVNVLNSNAVKVISSGAVPKTDILPDNELIKNIKFQLDDVVAKTSKASEPNKTTKVNTGDVETPKPGIVKSEDQFLKNISGSKLIQSIKKLDNKMLRPDFIPKEIKFNPASVDEIKNQKFELFNLNSAVRAIKSMSRPAGEFAARDESKSINKTFTINKIDTSDEITDKIKNAENSKNVLSVKSGDVLTALKSKTNTVEVKELKEFISANKNSDLIIKIIPKNNTVNNEVSSATGLEKQVKSVGSSNTENIEPIKNNEKFEIDLEKLTTALKEKGGNKEIQKFIELQKDLPKAKIVIETVKQTPAEQPELKQQVNLPKSSTEVAEGAALKQTVPTIEKLDNPVVKSSEANLTDQSKEQKIESASKPDQSASGSENKNSENRQAANNNNSKTNETESVKVNVLPADESFKENLKSVNTVANLETASANSSGDIVSLPKELAGNMREVKAADIYKELYKLIDKKEKQSISLQVIPKMLGKIKIVVDIIDQMVQTKIEVETESAKQLLQNNMEMLKQSLNQSGIQLNSYTISLSNPNSKNFKPFSAKKKTSGEDDLEKNDFDNTPVSGKKMGYNTYEYLI